MLARCRQHLRITGHLLHVLSLRPTLYGVPLDAIYRVAPFAAFIAVLALRGALEAAGVPALVVQGLYALQALAAAALLALFWRHYLELTEPLRLRDGLLALAAGVLVFVVWINATAPWMRLGEPVATFVPLDEQGRYLWALIAVRIVGAAIVVPLMEELFWRGFLMRWVDRRAFLTLAPGEVSTFAWIASSAVFALAHDLWLAGFVAGLVYGQLYRMTGNLWVPIAAHAMTNLVLAAWVVHGLHWSFW